MDITKDIKNYKKSVIDFSKWYSNTKQVVDINKFFTLPFSLQLGVFIEYLSNNNYSIATTCEGGIVYIFNNDMLDKCLVKHTIKQSELNIIIDYRTPNNESSFEIYYKLIVEVFKFIENPF